VLPLVELKLVVQLHLAMTLCMALPRLARLCSCLSDGFWARVCCFRLYDTGWCPAYTCSLLSLQKMG